MKTLTDAFSRMRCKGTLFSRTAQIFVSFSIKNKCIFDINQIFRRFLWVPSLKKRLADGADMERTQ